MNYSLEWLESQFKNWGFGEDFENNRFWLLLWLDGMAEEVLKFIPEVLERMASTKLVFELAGFDEILYDLYMNHA